jgi:hypothetical protein
MIRLFFQRVPLGIRDLSQNRETKPVCDGRRLGVVKEEPNIVITTIQHVCLYSILCGWYKMIQPDGGKDTLDRQVPAQQQLFLIVNMFKSIVNILFLKWFCKYLWLIAIKCVFNRI